jgi:hypothetical protein
MDDSRKGRCLRVKAQKDFIDRLSQAPKLAALEELVWNAFDERARNVAVTFDPNRFAGGLRGLAS